MKTEDGGSDGFLHSLPPSSPVSRRRSSGAATAAAAAAAAAVGGASALTMASAAENATQMQKRTVCDHCRRRRIRCDGQLPCQPCVNASLQCKRDHVPLKRGPKRGRGRVINELREHYSLTGTASGATTSGATASGSGIKHSRESSSEQLNSGQTSAQPTSPLLAPPPTDISWQHVSNDPRHAPEPGGAFSSEQYRPTSRSYFSLIPQCVELYYEHVYPIMPLPYMPVLRSLAIRSTPTMNSLSWSERNYLLALCALTCFHMSGQNIAADAPTPSWECAGRFFLDECILARQSYDFLNDTSLSAVMSSFWLSTSFFEINQSRKSWLYLREALTLAQELRLHDDSTYYHLDPAEALCRRRMFWQLFVTERSFAILRMKPITLKKTPSLPRTRHSYESREIHAGFLQLISSYAPLDESFVNAWNEGSDPRVSIATYLALQNVLAVPPSFLTRPGTSATSGVETMATSATTSGVPSPVAMDSLASSPSTTTDVGMGLGTGMRVGMGGLAGVTVQPPDAGLGLLPDGHAHVNASAAHDVGGVGPGRGRGPAIADMEADVEVEVEPEPETTAIQKADLLVTQQWLRLIVWQSSFRQQLLSWTAPDESMRFAFPLAIASRTAAILQSLPPQAIEVHGMGIFEKIFEIGTWSMNVLHACDMTGAGGSGSASASGSRVGGSGVGGSSSATAGSSGVRGAGMGMGVGMDFAGASEIGVLGVGRMGFSVDPLEFFVRTLSASPNSRKQYAERLLLFANEHPGGLRMSLSPALSLPVPSSPEFSALSFSSAPWISRSGQVGQVGPVVRNSHNGQHLQQFALASSMAIASGSVLGEVADEKRAAGTGPSTRMDPSMGQSMMSVVGQTAPATTVGGDTQGVVPAMTVNTNITFPSGFGDMLPPPETGFDVYTTSALSSPTSPFDNGIVGLTPHH